MLKLMKSVLKMMIFALKMMIFALKMMIFALKMMDYVVGPDGRNGEQPRGTKVIGVTFDRSSTGFPLFSRLILT